MSVPSQLASTLDGLKAVAEQIVLDPKYHDLLAIVKGARNGAVYGAKVRFPHALVMVFLFRSGTVREKVSLVLRATKHHASNLARFAIIYKTTRMVLKYLADGKEGTYDSFIGGLLGGYIVFGGRSKRSGKISSINMQIVIYVFARVVLALAKLAVKPGVGLPLVSQPPLSQTISYYAWPAFAAGSWAMVMHLFRYHDAEIQSSLRNSMSYIYVQSDHWDSLRTLLWHNK
ncbi:peroxisomal membrane protein 4 [Sporothrix brasiliensis 5110]|uniref:Peroxisomal membrane protein 4 n=1 Tax=Sporothrix brasiliensis 5110 TaxID=1398154 RepID=A0A0C2FJQ6_9PEZI|nr:peroxisomal membrane protein 4 [Sporothrix brasiliensis 5110]KIH91258.1 peroxisomal membrane protein 4 [Sporothrix brasiliensis 5110]